MRRKLFTSIQNSLQVANTKAPSAFSLKTESYFKVMEKNQHNKKYWKVPASLPKDHGHCGGHTQGKDKEKFNH